MLKTGLAEKRWKVHEKDFGFYLFKFSSFIPEDFWCVFFPNKHLKEISTVLISSKK